MLYFENIVTLSDALRVLRLVAACRHSLSMTLRAESKCPSIKTQAYFLETALATLKILLVSTYVSTHPKNARTYPHIEANHLLEKEEGCFNQN
jgi:hypothetical protein